MKYIITFTADERAYLARLVKQDYKKRERGVAKLAPHPEQSTEEFTLIWERVAGKLPFIAGVATKLRPTVTAVVDLAEARHDGQQ